MKATLRILAAASALAIAAPALATTINFDTLPDGTTLPIGYGPEGETLIGTQYASLGVTFTGTYGDGTTGSPVATAYAAGPEGPNYQANYLGNSTSGQFYTFDPVFAFVPRFQTVSILFDGGADDVSLSHNDFSLSSRTTFNAYGAGGVLLGTMTVNDGNGWAVRSFAFDDIYRLDLVAQANGIEDLDYDFFGIDNLTYTLNAAPPGGIPEPATWAMMIGGIGMAGGTLRRRVRTTVTA